MPSLDVLPHSNETQRLSSMLLFQFIYAGKTHKKNSIHKHTKDTSVRIYDFREGLLFQGDVFEPNSAYF